MSIRPIWHLSFLACVQFPWRLLLLFSFVIAAAGALIIENEKISVKYRETLCIVFFLASILYAAPMLQSNIAVYEADLIEMYDSFAIGLVWGIYENGSLKNTFR